MAKIKIIIICTLLIKMGRLKIRNGNFLLHFLNKLAIATFSSNSFCSSWSNLLLLLLFNFSINFNFGLQNSRDIILAFRALVSGFMAANNKTLHINDCESSDGSLSVQVHSFIANYLNFYYWKCFKCIPRLCSFHQSYFLHS